MLLPDPRLLLFDFHLPLHTQSSGFIHITFFVNSSSVINDTSPTGPWICVLFPGMHEVGDTKPLAIEVAQLARSLRSAKCALYLSSPHEIKWSSILQRLPFEIGSELSVFQISPYASEVQASWQNPFEASATSLTGSDQSEIYWPPLVFSKLYNWFTDTSYDTRDLEESIKEGLSTLPLVPADRSTTQPPSFL